MAAAAAKARCVVCGKDKSTLRCEGCLQTFCYNHVQDHRQELSKQFDEIEVSRDLFRQTLTEQSTEPRKHALIKQIDKWENDSINKIRQTAEEARHSLLNHTTACFHKLEEKLNKLTKQLRECREENDFFEGDLQQWKQQLDQLRNELEKPTNVTVRHTSTSLVNKICVDVYALSNIPNIDVNAKWIQNGTTAAGGNGGGSAVNQLHNPQGLCVNDDGTIYVADYNNHRIMEWKSGATNGQVVAGGNGEGNRNDQLNDPTHVIVDRGTDSLIISDRGNQRIVLWPRRNGTNGEVIISDIYCFGLTMDNDGYFYIPDYNKHEVKRWKIGETSGILVAGGNAQGNGLNQLHGPISVFVDQDQTVYVSDFSNHRVMKWLKGAKEGIIVAGGNGAGAALTQLNYPRGVVVDNLGTVYVVDCRNHRVTRWLKGATQGSTVVGGNGQGAGINQLNSPTGLSFDRQGNIYVADNNNHRIQKCNLSTNSST